jgi:lipoate-protein ligase A
MRTAEEKVPGGKLVRITLMPDGRIRISGDFFMHPEESIVQIENVLGRLDGTESPDDAEHILQRAVTESGIELIGVDVPAIVRLYRKCQYD